MGLGTYNFSALQAIQGIAFRTLGKYTTAEIVDVGMKVIQLVERFKEQHPDKVVKQVISGGLLSDGSSYTAQLNDFEIAQNLVFANSPEMQELTAGAKGLPELMAYLSVITIGKELPTESLLESALPFAVASLSLESSVAKRWSESLETEVARLAPLASTGLKFKGGKPKGAFGPVATAVRKRLLKNSKENPNEIWQALSMKPPKGMTFYGIGKGRRIESESLKEPSKKYEAEPSMWVGLGGKTQAGKQLVITTTGWARFRAIVIEQKENIKSCTE